MTSFTEQELNRLYRYACALLCGEQDAFDLLQSALERYLKAQKQQQNPMAYMRSIMRNLYIDQLRHNALIRWDDFDEEQTLSADLNWNALEQTVIAEDLADHVLRKLTGIEREIVFMWAVEGFSTAEVAKQLGMPKNTVLSRIHRLRQKIQANSNLSAALGGEE